MNFSFLVVIKKRPKNKKKSIENLLTSDERLELHLLLDERTMRMTEEEKKGALLLPFSHVDVFGFDGQNGSSST